MSSLTMQLEAIAAESVSPYPASTDSYLVLDAYNQDPRYVELSSELRTLLCSATRDHTPEWDHDPIVDQYRSNPSWLRSPQAQHLEPGQITGSTHYNPDRNANLSAAHRPVATVALPWHGLPPLQVARLLRIWLNECAPWLDMFDEHNVFGRRVPGYAQHSKALAFALLALSARQHERFMKHTSIDESIQLYSDAISALSANLDAGDTANLVAACILCVLEMMSARPRDWRRHLEGCAALFAAAGAHGLSPDVPRAVFWCYTRMDLCSAIISDGATTTVLPTNKWFLLDRPDDLQDYASIRAAIGSNTGITPDMQANYMVYLVARACDMLHDRAQTSQSPGVGYEQRDQDKELQWYALWNELQLWRRDRLAVMLPIRSASGSAIFPGAVFAHFAAISSNQLYHTACIMMLEMRQSWQADGGHESMFHDILWHARRVVGISLCNPHKGNLNNSIQPLFVAGRLFSHWSEQRVIVDLLDAIESESGWAARWRIKDLEIAWGYQAGTFSQAKA